MWCLQWQGGVAREKERNSHINDTNDAHISSGRETVNLYPRDILPRDMEWGEVGRGEEGGLTIKKKATQNVLLWDEHGWEGG